MSLSPVTFPSCSRLSCIEAANDTILLMPSHMPAGYRGQWHQHSKGQLIYPRQGRYRVYTRQQVWIGSPRRACWIPHGIEHTVWAIEALDIHNVYMKEVSSTTLLPHECRQVPVMPLLEELLLFGTSLNTADNALPLKSHTLALIAELIHMAYHSSIPTLPLAANRQVRKIMDELLSDPADNRRLEEWALITHCSERTLARHFHTHAGMSFSQWRQRLRAIEAVARLESGHPIKQVACDLGYASQSAFTAMFHRTVGCCPSLFKTAAI